MQTDEIDDYDEQKNRDSMHPCLTPETISKNLCILCSSWHSSWSYRIMLWRYWCTVQVCHNIPVSSIRMVCRHCQMPSWSRWSLWWDLSGAPGSALWYFVTQRSVQYTRGLSWNLLAHGEGFGPLRLVVCWATLWWKPYQALITRWVLSSCYSHWGCHFLESFTSLSSRRLVPQQSTSYQILLNSTTSCSVMTSLPCFLVRE